MPDPFIEQLRPLGLEKYAGRLTRVTNDAMQVVLGNGQMQKGLLRDEGGELLISDIDSAAGRLSGDGDFVLDILRKLGEDRVDELVARANVTDKAALQAFRDRAKRNKGILPTLEIGLGGVAEKLSRDRTGLKSEFEKLRVGTTDPDTSTLVPGALLPTGPMMTMSNSMGCTGAYLAIGGGAGLMVGGIILEDSAMFGFGAVALGIGIGAAAYFC
jgi:hypothetical protein